MSMHTVNMHEAKPHLSRLVERASKSEGFIIAKAGKPLVKVVPLEARATVLWLRKACLGLTRIPLIA
jgi:prevent-host-death family protein